MPMHYMSNEEQLCYERALQAWREMLKRTDLTEEARVKGALIAYQRQWFALHLLKDVDP